MAYFDGPGGTQVPRAVVEAMADYLYAHNANTHWRYPVLGGDGRGDRTRRGRLWPTSSTRTSSEIVFGQNMTTLTYHLSRALGRMWGPGDEIVVTELDHHANVDPWRALERERGVTVRCGADVARRRGPRSGRSSNARSGARRPVCWPCGAASNALGTINDVKRGAELARAAGALYFVDAVHYAPHVLDRRGRDRLRLPGLLAVQVLRPAPRRALGTARAARDRRRAQARCPRPTIRPASGWRPARCRTRRSSGAAAAVDFLASLSGGPEAPAPAGSRPNLCGPSRAGRRALRPAVERPGRDRRRHALRPASRRAAHADGVVRGPGHPGGRGRGRAVQARAVFVSSGDFYAWTVVRRLGHGADGVVRAGCACYTTEEEVERLLEGVREIAGRRASRIVSLRPAELFAARRLSRLPARSATACGRPQGPPLRHSGR